MKRLISIWFVLLCISCPLVAQDVDGDVLDISWLHKITQDTTRVDSVRAVPMATDTLLAFDTLSWQLPDTVAMTIDKQDTVIILHGLLDSLNQITVLDEDAVLLELIARQSELLHANDTIWDEYPHPLCMYLMYIPTTFPSLSDTTPQNEYTIPAIRAKARRYITAHHANFYTAVSDTNRLKTMVLDHVDVQRAIVKDLEEDRLDIERALRYKDSPWRKELNLSLQITQNYATENWYQGTANAFAMLASAKGKLNYKKDNISWENVGEWRAGINTVSGDSLRMINTTDDLFRINSKFGYQILKQLYASAVAEFRTNLMNNWRKNTHELSSAFMTPIRFTLGLGLDYKPLKGLDITLSPATYKMVYALNTDPSQINVTEYGIEEGKHMLNEVGSSLRVDWKWRPLREIIVETNFYFFTNYQRIETELEVNVDFIINRYFSAKLMLHPRYDSTVVTSDQKTKIQFKEFISIGFSHTFR